MAEPHDEKDAAALPEVDGLELPAADELADDDASIESDEYALGLVGADDVTLGLEDPLGNEEEVKETEADELVEDDTDVE